MKVNLKKFACWKCIQRQFNSFFLYFNYQQEAEKD